MAAQPITLKDLTEVKITGEGAFDQLMQALRNHLAEERSKGRMKDQEYGQVLSAGIAAILQNAVVFLLQKDEAANKAALIEAQIKLTEKQGELIDKQIQKEEHDAELIKAKTKLTLEQAKLPESQIKSAGFQDLLTQEQTKMPAAQIRKLDAEITSQGFQDLQVQATTKRVDQETKNLVSQNSVILKQAEQLTQQILNAKQELLNLVAQECLLKAQYDLTMEQKLSTTAQTALVQQKTNTERAQTVASGTDPDSVIGRQKALYLAQSEGFKRDAEQKAAKILVDSWNVRRTTDEGTVADQTNGLFDPNIGRAINKLLSGAGA
ncbi:putative structural protein [Pseudomonas phage vB_Pae_AM.P2]|uniref:Putative structural protein n=1 Tax=Pseudomonas phage vB_Pae_AM.P2 TaxID=2731695 RepID=A0A7S6B681_9CAUD|nr:putative structural protein [Pseudomonas phage vB_Pae_AM.P2]